MEENNSTIESTPPPLPDRSKSVGELQVSKPVLQKNHTSGTTVITNDPMGEHYAHLGKHVQEVRRRKNNGLIQPKLSQFQVKEGDLIIETNWFEYIQTWIKYFVASAAYDEVDRPLEPFSLNLVKRDLDRLYPMLSPFIEPITKIRSIYRWENKILTGALASFYLILWWNDFILPFICISIAVMIALVRIDMFAQYGVDALEIQPETEATVKSWNRSFWMKMRTSQKSSYGFNLFSDISISEWRDTVYTKYGPTIQLILSDTVDYLERIKNLVTWKRPAKTRFLLFMIIGLTFFLTILPLRLIGKLTFLYIGFEFFVLQALRSHYPRHRRLFNVLNLLLWDVPNDAEYALEVVRLNKNNSSREIVDTSLTTESPPKPYPTKLSASMSDLSTSIVDSVNTISRNDHKGASILETATTTTTTLAMLAAAATVNKVKQTVDNKKKKKEDDSIPVDDEPDAFGCMYKGTIPGRIRFRENEFIFQTSRMTGSKILIECAFNDIIGVKKTKQYDMIVWHANGIDISLSDGMTLHFENVLRRDDCFNRLVLASDGEWKKI